MKFLIGLTLILMGICVEAMSPKDNSMSSCDKGEFRCDSGWCIHHSQHCDDQFDCYDQSDERGCDNIKGLKIANKELEETIKNQETRIKNIEVGVRLIDEDGKTSKEYIAYGDYTKNRSSEIKKVKKRQVRGRIEVFQVGGWQKLCIKGKRHWEHWKLAMAACQTLGYEDGGPTHIHRYTSTYTFEKGLEESGVSKYYYNCKGDEKSIFECDREEKESECDADGPPTDWAAAGCWSYLAFYSKDWDVIPKKREITTLEIAP